MIQVLLERTSVLECMPLPCPGEVNLHMDLEGAIGVYLKEKSIVGRKNT